MCCSLESVGLRGRLLRRIEALRAKESGSDVPDEFLCPITRELMEDPVISAGKSPMDKGFTTTCFSATHTLFAALYVDKEVSLSTDGYSYERASIESWLRGKSKTSPMTNLPLQTALLTPNRSLKMAILRWKSSH